MSSTWDEQPNYATNDEFKIFRIRLMSGQQHGAERKTASNQNNLKYGMTERYNLANQKSMNRQKCSYVQVSNQNPHGLQTYTPETRSDTRKNRGERTTRQGKL